MNVPKLRFKEFDGELIEDIIQNYAEVQTGPFGSQLHEKDYVKVGTPIITVEHFGDNRIIHKNLPMVSNEDKERLKKYSLKEGDVVFSRVGSIDRRVYVTEREDGWLFSGRCLRLRIINTNLSSKYLSTYLGTTKCLNEIRSKAVGGTMPSLNTDILNSISINLPQYKEQEKVASFFEKLDKKIQLQQQKIDLLQEQKKGYMQKIFKREWRFKEFTQQWKTTTIGSLAEISRGASPRPIQDPKWFDGNSNVGWLRISDVTKQNGRIHYLEQKISILGQEKTRVLETPHLLLSIAATVGKPVINYIPTGVHDGFLIFYNPTFNVEFMFQWLEMFRDNWQKYGQPGSQVNLNSELVKNQEISIPVIEEQQKIAGFLTLMDKKIQLQKEKLELLQKQKQGFMQQMFI